MKRTFFLFLLVMLGFPLILRSQTNKVLKDVDGKWQFEAPYAPEGYKSGTIEFVITDKSSSVSMVFEGDQNKFLGESLKFANDSIFYSVQINSEPVAVKLAVIEKSKMTGKAIYSQGVVPLTLTKEKK